MYFNTYFLYTIYAYREKSGAGRNSYTIGRDGLSPRLKSGGIDINYHDIPIPPKLRPSCKSYTPHVQ